MLQIFYSVVKRREIYKSLKEEILQTWDILHISQVCKIEICTQILKDIIFIRLQLINLPQAHEKYFKWCMYDNKLIYYIIEQQVNINKKLRNVPNKNCNHLHYNLLAYFQYSIYITLRPFSLIVLRTSTNL